MNYLHIIVIFLLVLFIYIHIQFQLTPADERQIYVIDKPVNAHIEDVLELKQPIVFRTTTMVELTREKLRNEHPTVDISVYDNTRKHTHAHILSSVSATHSLLESDDQAKYYSEKNTDMFAMVPSTSTLHEIAKKHAIFAPPLCSRTRTDVLFGSVGATTIPQYSVMFRNIFSVTSGTMHIRLIHPDDFAKRGEQIKPDYTNMSFFTSTDADLWGDDNTNIISATIHTGESVSIPPYWVYSFKYEENAFVVASSFNSYMTEIATMKHTVLYWVTKFTRPGNIANTNTNTPNRSTVKKVDVDDHVVTVKDIDATTTTTNTTNTTTKGQAQENLETNTDTDNQDKPEVADSIIQNDNEHGATNTNTNLNVLDVMVPTIHQ